MSCPRKEKSKQKKRLGYPETRMLIGRLVEQKSFIRLLHAAKRLLDDSFVFELLILGEGPDEADLRSFIKKSCISDCVKLLGFKANPYSYMNCADWLVCSSLVEGLSTVAVEATIVGLPVITTECAGMKEILGDNEYGIIVENSENGIYSALSGESSALVIPKMLGVCRAVFFCVNCFCSEFNNLYE